MKDKIFKIFSSSIKIRVTGRNVNNFIKKLIRSKINIIRVIPISYKEIDIIINYKDLEKVESFKSIYDVKIIKYYGKLKCLKIIKNNFFIFFFLILGFIMIYLLSHLIFSIDIIHSNNNIIRLLENELKNNGIKKYSFIKSYEKIEKIENKILENNKEVIEWLEIIREGTKYIVRVEERIINDELDDNKNYNIVSSKNAVIKSINAQSGEKVKSIDTYVKKGEVIISSYITKPNNEKVLDTARGTVIGEVWYMIDIEYPYNYNEVIYTGNKKKVLVFNFINKRISLFDFNKYKSFDKDTKYIFKNTFIPISLINEYQYETKVIDEIYTYDEVKDKAILLAKKKLMEKYDNIIEVNKVMIVNEEDLNSRIKLSLFISCNENITEYVEVKENTENETIQ